MPAPDSSYAASVPARQTTALAVVRPGRDRDPARREQVGRERRPRGVRGDRAEGGQEHRRGGGLVAERLERGAVAADVVGLAVALGQRLGEVRELGEPGDGRRRVATARRAAPTVAASASSSDAPDSRACTNVPGGHREVVGEPLDRPGTACGVGDGADVRLVGQQRHLVAGDPAAEGVGAAEGAVEGLHGDGVGATDRRGEGGDRGAEHVDPGVVRAHHRPAGDGVLPLRRRGDVPQISSSRAQSSRAARSLAMVEELVVGRGVAELDQAGCPLDVDAARLEDAQDPRGGDDRPAQLLGVGGAPVVDGGGVDHDAEDSGVEGQPRDGDEVVVGRVGGERPGWCRSPAWCRPGGRGSARPARPARTSRRGRPGRGRAGRRRGRRRGRCPARRAATARRRRR